MTASVLDGATPEHWATVQANTGLVWRKVNMLRLAEDQRDDAYQDGLFGLLRAAQKFDASKGFAFSTYADVWIAQAIMRGRERFEGCNFRRETRNTSTRNWTPPASIDEDIASGGDQHLTLQDVLPAACDTEHEGVLSAMVSQAVETMLGACQDVVDLEVVASMVEGEVRGVLTDIGQRHGMTREGVRRRRVRLQRLAQEHYVEAA